MTKPVIYIAHPVGATPEHSLLDNTKNTWEWLKWLVDNTPWAISIPWLPYIQVLPEYEYRERGLEDDLAMLAKHDGLALVGGRISDGMRVEMVHAIALHLPILDLTMLERHVPVGIFDNAIAARLEAFTCEVRTAMRKKSRTTG